MKKNYGFCGIFLLAVLVQLLIVCTGNSYAQTWRKLYDEPLSTCYGTYFLNSEVGWVATASKTLNKTTDGGHTWTEKFINANVMRTVQFVNNSIGYAGGDKLLIVKTTDGGETWNQCNPGDTPLNVVSIYFSDENTGWVAASATDSAAIFKTTDGGATWNRVLTVNKGKGMDLEDMAFYGTRGVAVGGGVGSMVIYYTSDGNTWTEAPIPSVGGVNYTRADLRGVYVVNDNVVYASGYGSNVGAQPSLLIKSTDGGATWQYLAQPEGQRTYGEIRDLYFKDELNGIGCGGGSSTSGSILLKTTDGGVNWIPCEVFAGCSMHDMSAKGDEIFLTGGGGNVFHSTDFGTTWTKMNDISECTLHSIECPGEGLIYAGGTDGVFQKSTDNGRTWSGTFATDKKICTFVYDIFFLDKNIGYAGQSYKVFNKTTDGGQTWKGLMETTTANMTQNNGVYFFNEDTGIVAGIAGSDSDILYKTVDGGQNWATTSSQVASDLNSITFYNQTNGVITADNSKIYYTTDRGETWTKAAITDVTAELDINEAAFVNESKGFAVGEKIMLTTNDGGKTWSSVPGFTTDKTLESVRFFDADSGYAVGAKYIYKTTDGGATWTDVCDTNIVKSSLYSVAVDNKGYAWISGGSGLIITNSPETPDVSVEEGVNSPNSFDLKQNYPNPFNPSTSISYSVEKRSRVTIRVFDVSGREVDVLFDGEREAGSYTINYNASKLASGVYFCTMQAGNKIKSLKMSLIK